MHVGVIEASTQGWANRAAVVPQMGWVQLRPSSAALILWKSSVDLKYKHIEADDKMTHI